MKGKILSSILALGASFAVFAHGGHHMATAPMAAAPEYFNGWVVGIDGSVQHMTGNVQDVPTFDGTAIGSTPSPAPLAPPIINEYNFSSTGNTSLKSDIGDIAAGGGLFVGYGKVLNNSKFYLGGEAYARYAHNITNTITTEDSLVLVESLTEKVTNPTFTDITATGTFEERSSVDVSSDWSYGAALKLGYLVTPKTMLYLLAGLEYSKFDVDVSHSGESLAGDNTVINNPLSATDSYSFDENKVAFVPGVGIETMLTDKLSLKAEYTYADYGDLDTQHHNTTFEYAALVDTTNYDVTVNSHSEDKVSLKRGLFSLGLAYHFNGI